MTKLQKSLFILFNSFIIISFFAGILHFFWQLSVVVNLSNYPTGFQFILLCSFSLLAIALSIAFLPSSLKKRG